MGKLEERLALLEHRMALLEAKKNIAVPERGEKLLTEIGLAHMLRYAGEKLIHDPNFNGMDDFLQELFKCEVTPEKRHDCSYKLIRMSTSVMEKAYEDFKKSKDNI